MLPDHGPFLRTRFLPNPHFAWVDVADWRWQRAGYLLAHGRHPLDLDDASTRLVWRFRRRQSENFVTYLGGLPATEFAAMASAYELHRGPALRRWEVESRFLAKQTDVEIARACELTPMAVQAYHDAFYAVRPHLKARLYVIYHIIGWTPDPLPGPDDHERLLKFFGFSRGSPAIEAYLELIREPLTVPACPETLDGAEQQRLCRKLQTRMQVLLLTTPASAMPSILWMRLKQLLGDSHLATPERSDASARAAAAIASTLDRLTVASSFARREAA